MKVKLLADDLTYAGFFEPHRLSLEHDRFDGSNSGPVMHEVLHRSDVVAALLIDPVADKVVLVEQFRAGAYVAKVDPWIVDFVAGRIEGSQTPRVWPAITASGQRMKIFA